VKGGWDEKGRRVGGADKGRLGGDGGLSCCIRAAAAAPWKYGRIWLLGEWRARDHPDDFYGPLRRDSFFFARFGAPLRTGK